MSILQAFNEIVGVEQVVSDDWDSQYVNVFLYLHLDNGYYPIRKVKSAIKRILSGTDWRLLHQPQKQYESNGSIFGKRLKSDKGYDCNYIKIEMRQQRSA